VYERLTKVDIKVSKESGSDSYIDKVGDTPGSWRVNFGIPVERGFAASIALDIFFAKFWPHDPETELQFVVIAPDTNEVLKENEDNYLGYSEAHRGKIEHID